MARRLRWAVFSAGGMTPCSLPPADGPRLVPEEGKCLQ